MEPKVYLLDDDLSFAKLLAVNLRDAGVHRTEVFQSAEELLARRGESPPDAVITDLRMPEMDGIEVTRRLRQADPHLPIFVLTAHAEMTSAIDALKAGANEYLTKPVNLDELTTLLRRALAERPKLEEVAALEATRKQEFSAQALLGSHKKLDKVKEFVRKVAGIPYPTVLLYGESGTGKNLVAQAIHYSSPHTAGRFVEINCSALPAPLLEAELFGHKKGAFTDAKESKRGLFEVANGGTLFLDEIGDLSFELQAKLLNFLESRRFRRVGGTDDIEVTLRIITATNRHLEDLVQAKGFRQDLFYRLNVATLTLPPLRELDGDIPVIADHFREVFNAEFRKDVRSISAEALDALRAWEWPGNVRELRNVIERAMIFADGSVLEVSDLPPFGASERRAPTTGDGIATIPLKLTLVDAEKEYIRQTLEAYQGSVQRAAEALGISRKNLWQKRKKYGLLD
jgi:DNA-binding NtrC family response regulator